MNANRLFLLSPLVLLCACSTLPVYQPLPPAARDAIASTEVVVPIRQREIYVYVPPTTAGAGYGLIGALVDVSVDSVRTSKAEKAVTPLRDAIVDYDFDHAFKSNLQGSLAQLGWIHVDNVHVAKEVTQDSLDGALTGSKDAAVLFLTTDYNLDNDARGLTITVYAALYANDATLKALMPKAASKPPTAPANALYRDTLVFGVPLDGATDDRDQNIAKWSADKGAMMRAALDKGAQRVAADLAADLQRNDAGTPANAGAGKPAGAP